MTEPFEHLQEHLEFELKHLTEKLELMLIPDIADQHESSLLSRTWEISAESMELEQRLAQADQIRKALTDVILALEKLKKGTYGRCDLCGKPIPASRLEALPQANLCLDCNVRQVKESNGHQSKNS